MTFSCDTCSKSIRHKRNLKRHKSIHSKKPLSCNRCNKIYKRVDKLKAHNYKCDGLEDMRFIETDSAFERRIVDCKLQNRLYGDVGYVIGRVAHKIEDKVREYLEKFSGVKFNLWIECEFISPDGNVSMRNLKTSLTTAFRTSDISQIVQDKIKKLINEFDQCILKGSGWTYNRIICIELRLNKYVPLK